MCDSARATAVPSHEALTFEDQMKDVTASILVSDDIVKSIAVVEQDRLDREYIEIVDETILAVPALHVAENMENLSELSDISSLVNDAVDESVQRENAS